jgi:hypothetical protein
MTPRVSLRPMLLNLVPALVESRNLVIYLPPIDPL